MTINLDFSRAGAFRAVRDFILHEILIGAGAAVLAISADLGHVTVSHNTEIATVVFSTAIAGLLHIGQWLRATQATVDKTLVTPASTEFSGAIPAQG